MTHRGARIRPAAVAGSFYPADPATLDRLVQRCLADAVAPPANAPVPRALVVPHAGLVYSGPIAASAYLRLRAGRDEITRIALLGPSHRVALAGMALSSADAWATPFGLVPLDARGAALLAAQLDGVHVDDAAHALEHSLEVQLPFLQTVLGDFTLLPIVVGATTVEQVGAVIEAVWEDPHTVVVVSSDLSHYHRYGDAVRRDARTAAAVVARRYEDLASDDACGARPLRGLLHVARAHEATVSMIDLRNSGDTAGDRDRVVGYGAFALA